LKLITTSTLGIFLVALSATAGTYNAALDFSLASNPNGVWTYGQSSTLGGAFTPFVTNGTDGILESWGATPSVNHNPSASPVNNYLSFNIPIPGYGMMMHPGSAGEYAVLRFTAPNTDTFSLSAAFSGADCCTTTSDVHILVNGGSVFEGSVITGVSTAAFSTSLSLNSGDFVDFAVGYGGNGYWNDTTNVTAILTDSSAATPEPSTLPVLGLLILPAWRVIRRRRGN
jgi:hypothetical protein